MAAAGAVVPRDVDREDSVPIGVTLGLGTFEVTEVGVEVDAFGEVFVVGEHESALAGGQ
jgi:hypothetical protein